MAEGQIYFAWVGGEAIPAVNVSTTGDLWSGSVSTFGTTWGGSLTTSGDILSGGITVANLQVRTGLIAGQFYTLTGNGVPSIAGGALADTNLLYDGNGGGWLNQPCTVAEGVSLTLSLAGGESTVILEDISPLKGGTVYGIAGSGIQAGTTFTFSGSEIIAISNPATATGFVQLTITNPDGRNIVANLADPSGLVSGLTYEVFGRGVPAGAQGIYGGGDSLALQLDATISGIGVPLTISKGKTYPDGGAFNPVLHLREDEDIFALEISHEEGNFPSLQIDIRNPHIGLLAAGRNLWCWLSWDSGSEVVSLFHGRLLGIPANLQGEVVRLQFVACPNDYQALKTALAETLKKRPFWDPIWIAQGEADPDTVLEARPQSWHIDRTTLAVTVSDQIVGEDGSLILTADDHFYDGMEVSYGETPLRSVSVTGLVSWTQAGTGSVDLTQEMVDAFRGAGSPYYYPIVSSFTGPGLFDSWPKPGTSIGAGWSVDASASIETAGWAGSWLLPKAYLKPNFNSVTVVDERGHWVGTGVQGGIAWHPDVTHSTQVIASWDTWSTLFVLSPYSINFVAEWTASRPRTETISFVIEAAVQPLLTDPGAVDVATIDLSSSLVAEAVDPGGLLPIRDLRRNSYFNTDRGAQSIEFLIALARAKLLVRARAVNLKAVTTWGRAINLTCRQNGTVFDDRLPAGRASGKVVKYILMASGDTGEQSAEITLGCSVGASAADAGAVAAPATVRTAIWATNTAQVVGALFRSPGEATIMHPGDAVPLGTQWLSPSGEFQFVVQTDGNLVLYQTGSPLWSSGTAGEPATDLQLQTDGNLVLVGRVAIWETNTVPVVGALFRSPGATTILAAGEAAFPGTRWFSPSGEFEFTFQTDGNLVLYQTGVALWSSGTAGQPATVLQMQTDGNLVLYDGATPIWASGTNGPDTSLVLQNDGNLVLYEITPIWATGTDGNPSASLVLQNDGNLVLYTVAHAGASSYADDYIDGYYATSGATLDPGTGDFTYQNFDELDVLDDDGIDFFNMTPDRVLNSITIEGGVNHQAFVTLGRFPTYDGQRLVGPFIAADALIAEVPAFAPQSEYLRIQEAEVSWAAQYVEEDDPSTVLGRDPTRVSIDLVPIGTQAFETNYAPVVSALAVPQTIDTEAP